MANVNLSHGYHDTPSSIPLPSHHPQPLQHAADTAQHHIGGQDAQSLVPSPPTQPPPIVPNHRDTDRDSSSSHQPDVPGGGQAQQDLVAPHQPPPHSTHTASGRSPNTVNQHPYSVCKAPTSTKSFEPLHQDQCGPIFPAGLIPDIGALHEWRMQTEAMVKVEEAKVEHQRWMLKIEQEKTKQMEEKTRRQERKNQLLTEIIVPLVQAKATADTVEAITELAQVLVADPS